MLGRDLEVQPSAATDMLPQQAVCPSTISLSEKRRQAHANSSNDPEVQTRHPDENGWQEPGPTVLSIPWDPAPSWQGPILLTPVSPNLDMLMNPCPGNVFRGAVRPSRQPIRKPTLPLYSELCPILGLPWPSFNLLQAGELQPQGPSPLPSGPRLQILDILLPLNTDNPNLLLGLTVSPQT